MYFSACVCASEFVLTCVLARACVCGCPTAWACACECARVALLVEHATSMCHIVLSLWPLWLHHIFRNYLINGTIFGKKLLNITFVSWSSLQRLRKTFLILRRTCRDIVINVKRLHVRYQLFSSCFKETLIFSTGFRKKLKYQILWKSVQWEPSWSMRTDMTRLIVAFRSFENAPKNWQVNCVLGYNCCYPHHVNWSTWRTASVISFQ